MKKSIILMVLTLLFFSCSKDGNRFFIEKFGRDGSNSSLYKSRGYSETSWGYHFLNPDFSSFYKKSSFLINTRDSSMHNCPHQNMFIDKDF